MTFNFCWKSIIYIVMIPISLLYHIFVLSVIMMLRDFVFFRLFILSQHIQTPSPESIQLLTFGQRSSFRTLEVHPPAALRPERGVCSTGRRGVQE